MSTVVALHWNETTLHFVVVQHGDVAAAASVGLAAGLDASAIGRQLSEALVPYATGRANAVVALGRGALELQRLTLPPCPVEELPDVVRLQLDRDLADEEDDVGFDYLTLAGDEQTPYQVLAVTMDMAELDSIRQTCQAANLTLERIVPLAAGWPPLAKQAAAGANRMTHIFVAPQSTDATVWATHSGDIVLIRQFQLVATDQPAALTAAVSNELRRTLLALPEHAAVGTPKISLVGHQSNELAELARLLDEKLEATVRALDVSAQVPNLDHTSSITPATLPLAGLALDEARGNRPLVDLLHPHRRPQARVNVRTYVLAATAVVSLLLLLAWSSYAKLQAPLNQAALDQAELTLLDEQLDDLEVYEERAAAIRDWTAETPNLLIHLDQVSRAIRPQPLDAEEFSADQDIVLDRFDLDRRQLTLDANARSYRAVQPMEQRLSTSEYRPQRGDSDPSDVLKEYPWHFKAKIEITSASDDGENAASNTPAKEPQA